jgi:6,7-dimethyl-8-ribityllumazine synthase
MAESKKYDSIIALGSIIRGSTYHYELVANETAKGIAGVFTDTGIPVVFGVITCDTIDQAIERAGTKSGNKGAVAAEVAIEMANLYKELSSNEKR